jgi:heme/copper-type cytochrome/quinol oxidase subunit 2
MTLRRSAALAFTSAALVAALAGCGEDASGTASTPAPTTASATTATSPASPKATSTPTDDAVAVDITIEGRSITPAPSRVEVPVGSTVRLTVTSDVDNMVHIHGYDIEKDLPAGKAVTTEFVADQEGLFEVETHDEPELLLTQLQVQ